MYTISVMVISPSFMEDISGNNELQFCVAYKLRDRLLKTILVVFNVFFGRRKRFEGSFQLYLVVMFAFFVYDGVVLFHSAMHQPRFCNYKPFAFVKATISFILAWAALASFVAGSLPVQHLTQPPFIFVKLVV